MTAGKGRLPAVVPARSHTAGSAILSPRAWLAIARSLNLSGRELQIVRGVFDDKVEFAIAAELHVSPRTIHSHVERLHRKLAITNRAQLVLRVMHEFLVLTATASDDLPPICATRAAGRCRSIPARQPPSKRRVAQ